MKNEQLLEAIGTVEESLLMEAEGAVTRKKIKLGRLALAAAIVAVLGISAVAAAGAFSRPIEKAGIITGETVFPFDMDEEGNIIPVGIGGLKITMDVAVDEDAPEFLEEYYHLKVPAEWKTDGIGTPNGRYWLNTWERIWWQEDEYERMELMQTTVLNYKANGHQVDSLPLLSEDDGVTARRAIMAGLEVLKVDIPKLPWLQEHEGHQYCAEGETRLYWSDGRYILRFIYPAWVSDEEVEELLTTLYTEPAVISVPDSYGTVDMQRLQSLVPGLNITDSGNTSANIQMTQGRFAYRNGVLFCSLPGRIVSFELETGATQQYILPYAYTFPKYLFVTDHYIGYVSDYDMLELLPIDHSHEATVVYEGIPSICLYADGMDLYVLGEGLRKIDLTTGQITKLVADAHSFYVDENYVYAIGGEKETCVLRAEKGSTHFERIDLSFCPIRIVADGEDLYLCKGGDTDRNMIRYRQGKEELLPINAYFYQILDGKVIYRDELSENTIKSYDPDTGKIEVLQENVFEFSILEGRYICFDIFNSDSVILDTQTGKTVAVDTAV